MFRFSTRSPLDALNRAIQRRKFHATLPIKLDQAEEAWHKAQPPTMPPPEQIGDLHIRSPWSNDEQ